MIAFLKKILDKIRNFRIPALAILVGWFGLLYLIVFSKESWVWQSIKDAFSDASNYVREVRLS